MGTDDDDGQLPESDLADSHPNVDIPGDISSLNALMGRPYAHALSLEGSFGAYRFHVLIDSGSTHNFIKPTIVEHLQLLVSGTLHLQVFIGNGDFLLCTQRCSSVPIVLQGYKFTIDLFVLPIEGPDVVLGIQRLQSLGRVSHYYLASTMEFWQDGTKVVLTGADSIISAPISLHLFQTLIHSKQVEGLYELQAYSSSKSNSIFAVDPLPSNLPSDVITLLSKYGPLFQTPVGLPPHRPNDHRIYLEPNTKAINVRPYRYRHYQKNEIQKLVQEMLAQGIIKPSTNPFSSPVLLVKKKDGSWRFCVDYRALNEATIKDKFPIPTIDELLNELGGASIFSKLDFRAGYHHILLHSCDTHKTTFRTHDGHFEFLVMSFGPTNAPLTFQATMNRLFSVFLRKFVIVFFDDILVYSSSLTDHIGNLESILDKLSSNHFYVKLSKCFFCQGQIEYFGHFVIAAGVQADPQKLEAMVHWPVPCTLKLHRFLDLTGYYRHFIVGFASIAAPLTDLLRRDAFLWGPKAELAFVKLKEAMTQAPVLRLPDFTREFVVETEASNCDIGVMLMQDNHLIAFFSKKIGLKMQASSTYIKELHAITNGVRKWRQYLLGRFFVIRTYHVKPEKIQIF